jgi:hypothetical protein
MLTDLSILLLKNLTVKIISKTIAAKKEKKKSSSILELILSLENFILVPKHQSSYSLIILVGPTITVIKQILLVG